MTMIFNQRTSGNKNEIVLYRNSNKSNCQMKVILELLILFLSTIILESLGRNIVLTSSFKTGHKNVRYMTVANNYVDNNGNLVPNKSNTRKKADGSIIYDCIDIIGNVRKNGEVYERPNGKFKYSCDNGIEVIDACVASDRAQKSLIKIGETFHKDGFWYRCTFFPQNQTAIYTEENACNVDGKDYHVGDEIRSGFLRIICDDNGYKIAGCYFTSKDKKFIDMNPPSTIEDNGTIHHCTEEDGNIRYFTTASECYKDDRKFREGEKYQTNHLYYECKDGRMNIYGCYINTIGKDLLIGQYIVEKNMAYRCYRTNEIVHYEEFACGLPGTASCNLVPIHNETPSGESNVNIGFRSFSIGQVGHPSINP